MNILTTGMGWIDHTPGGLNRYFADYLKAMAQQGHTIKAYMTAGGERTAVPDYVEDVIAAAGSSSTWERMRAFRKTVAARIQIERPQVYNPHFALYSSLIGRGQLPVDIPIVTHFHGPWARESRVEDRGGTAAQLVRYQIKKTIENVAYRRSDRFVVLSRYFQSVLEEEYGVPASRIHLIPGAVDVEHFRPAEDRALVRKELGIASQSRVLFCVRRLVKRMGIDRLIRAMAEVIKTVPDAMLVIAGDGTMRAELVRLVEQLQLGGRVHFTGRISNSDLVRWYQAADFSVVPTVTLEGFGLVTIEALACGTPVMGTPNGGTKEILEPFSPELLFQDDSPESIAWTITAALEGRVTVPDRTACRNHVLQHYTWRQVALSVTEVFEQAVSERERQVAK